MKGPARQDAGPSQGGEARLDAVRFCTHCGVLQDEAPQRVCPLCGLGVILTSHRRALPRSGAAFLVVTRSLRVSAASVASEELLGRPPEELLGGSVLALVGGDAQLPRWVSRAATGLDRVVAMPVVALGSGRHVSARIGPCGDPPAALVVLE